MKQFRDVLGAVAERPESLQEKGEQARRRVFTRLTWQAKARQVLDVYAWVLGKREKPDFGMPLSDVEMG